MIDQFPGLPGQVDSEGEDHEEEDDEDEHGRSGAAQDSIDPDRTGPILEKEASILREFDIQKSMPAFKELKEKKMLAFGIFRAFTGCDFRGSRCRGEVLVERGPDAMIGCRVHVVGRNIRNGAYDNDAVGIRIKIVEIQIWTAIKGPCAARGAKTRQVTRCCLGRWCTQVSLACLARRWSCACGRLTMRIPA